MYTIPTYITDPQRYLENRCVTQYGLERDFQRSRVYNAEDALEYKGRSFSCVEEATEYCTHIYHLPWMRRFFPSLDPPQVVGGGGRESSYLQASNHIVLIPKHMCELILLHEIAHALVPKPHAHHGRMFCAVYLDLVKEMMSASNVLKESMDRHRVVYTHRT